MTLGSLCDYSGITLGWPWDLSGITLGTLWDHSGITLGVFLVIFLFDIVRYWKLMILYCIKWYWMELDGIWYFGLVLDSLEWYWQVHPWWSKVLDDTDYVGKMRIGITSSAVSVFSLSPPPLPLLLCSSDQHQRWQRTFYPIAAWSQSSLFSFCRLPDSSLLAPSLFVHF